MTFRNPFYPLPEDHEEFNPRIERFIKTAAGMLIFSTEEECVNALVKLGAEVHEAINAVRAAVILKESRNY